MAEHDSDKTTLVDNLLQSLRYGDLKKEDTGIIEQLCAIFAVPHKQKLRDHLIKTVDFSELFVELLKLAEPFTQMMNEIYEFLAAQRKTARSLEHLIVGENIQNKISFDLTTFPQLYQPIIQKIKGYLRVYNVDDLLNSNISPLALSENLLGCGHCTDPHYQRTAECQDCGIELRRRFEENFQCLETMASIIPDEIKNQTSYQRHWYEYLERANKQFHTGTHWNHACPGYTIWSQILDEIERRTNLVSEKQSGVYDINVLMRFFELPFWKERNRLYEIWTLTHFIYLLRGVTFDLNIKDGKWHLMYGDAKEAVAWIRGQNFEIEVRYQYKLKSGLKSWDDQPVEPEMLLVYHGQHLLNNSGREKPIIWLKPGLKGLLHSMTNTLMGLRYPKLLRRYHGDDGKTEILALIECKERKDYDVREVMKLSAFYRDQVGATLNIFCNYYNYSPPVKLKRSNDEPLIILCDQFCPGNEVVADIDNEFVRFMNKRLGIFLQTVLIDISGSMGGKNIEAIYQKLNKFLTQFPGSKSLGGIFADQVELCGYDELLEKIHHPPSVGGGTQLNRALSELRNELQKNNEGLAVINFYVITDIDFSSEDWIWLEKVDADGSYNITLVAQKDWVSDATRQYVEGQFHHVKLLFL